MFFVRGLGFLLVDTNGEEVLVGPRGLGIPFNSERDEWLLGTSAESSKQIFTTGGMPESGSRISTRAVLVPTIRRE